MGSNPFSEEVLRQTVEPLPDKALEQTVDLMVDDFVWEIAFQIHRLAKKKLQCFCGTNIAPDHVHEGLVNLPGVDVFGCAVQKPSTASVQCPHCSHVKQAAKFAPHLEKCMGLGGRESRRVAAQRNKQVHAFDTAFVSSPVYDASQV
eukprot:m.75379 g.75379  ORF g.75379 m.75379 type:complete len:147 (+) comp12448_c0_seq4:380-820(+)